MHISTLLFDLGGVLIRLGPVSKLMASSPYSGEHIWQNWITSPSVKAYESGRSTTEEFARDIIQEFQLDCDVSTFLARFMAWPEGPYPNADSTLAKLADQFKLACLSNTNIAHYENIMLGMPLLGRFEHCFFSHQIGHLKPSSEVFRHVINALQLAPDEILFFDDNEANVIAAREHGMQAERVNSPEDVLSALKRNGVRLS